MTVEQYLDSLLNGDTIVANYTEAAWYLNDCAEPSKELDVIARLGDALAAHIKTPQHYARARRIVSSLAVAVLEQAMIDGDYSECSEYVLLDELPDIDATEVRVCIS